ncbi:hypothetical protein [Singulisphaera sp. PoT]|uniref:hypothetical protein n=1 Tax=Singulisphaera sp. PoT TaxID=3411797 RepID=UPI003BF51D40
MLAAEISQIRSSWAAVWRGLDLYLALLTDEEPRLRLSAGYTIGTLCQIPRDGWPEENREGDGLETIVAAVRRQIARETDELAKAGHLFAPGALAGQARGAAEELRRQLVDPSSPPWSWQPR